MPSAFFVECLLMNPSLVSIRGNRWMNPSHTTPSRCRIIPFSLEYHQSHDVKYSVTLFRPKQLTTYTHSFFTKYWYRFFYSESIRIDRSDDNNNNSFNNNIIFGFSLRREIFCEHWYYLKRVPSAFIVESLLTNPLSIPSPLVGSVESANHSVTLWYYLFVFR